MIEIKHNSRNLNLFPDTSIRLSFKFPWPTTDTIPAASTYWFELPVNGNQWFFKNINFISNSSKLYKVSIELIIADLHFVADMFIKNGNYKSHKAFIVLNELVANLAKEKLTTLDHEQYLGEDTAAISIEVQNINTTFAANFAFPMLKNPVFFSSNTAYIGYINYWNAISNLLLPNYKDETGIHDINVMVAMPKVAFIIEKIFEKINYTVDNVFNRTDLSRLFLYSNFAIQNNSDFEYLFAENNNTITYPNTITFLTFPTVISDVDNAFQPDFETYVGSNAGNYKFVFRCYATTDVPNNLYFFVQINGVAQPHIGVTISTSGQNVTIEQTVTVVDANFEAKFVVYFEPLYEEPYYNAAISNSSIEVITSLDGNYDRFGKRFNLGEIMPDKTISELLNSLAKKFAIAVFFDNNNKHVQLQQFNDIINSQAYIDISEIVISKEEELFYDEEQLALITAISNNTLAEDNFKPLQGFTRLPDVDYIKDLPAVNSLNKLVLVRNENSYYTSYFDTTYKWQRYSDNFYDIIPNVTEVQEVTTDTSAVFMRTETGITLPAVYQQGTTNVQGQNEPGFILMNFWNMINQGGLNFPLASSSKYLYSTYEDVYGTDLNNEAIYNNYQKPLANYIAENKPVEFNLFMTFEYFKKMLDLFNAVSIGEPIRKVRVGSRKFIPETLDITVKMNGFGDTKIRLR